MSLLTAELRKVWGNRVFPILLAVLVAANLLLLWIGTRPTANQPPAAAYRAAGADLAALGPDMAIQRMATASSSKITGKKMLNCSINMSRYIVTRATPSTPTA